MTLAIGLFLRVRVLLLQPAVPSLMHKVRFGRSMWRTVHASAQDSAPSTGCSSPGELLVANAWRLAVVSQRGRWRRGLHSALQLLRWRRMGSIGTLNRWRDRTRWRWGLSLSSSSEGLWIRRSLLCMTQMMILRKVACRSRRRCAHILITIEVPIPNQGNWHWRRRPDALMLIMQLWRWGAVLIVIMIMIESLRLDWYLRLRLIGIGVRWDISMRLEIRRRWQLGRHR